MSEMLNEELAYMKYLLGYKKGVVVSEQKIILEREEDVKKVDYSVIFEKFPIDSLKKYGITNVQMDNIDGNRRLIFSTKYTRNNQELRATFICGSPDARLEGDRMYIQSAYDDDAKAVYEKENPGAFVNNQMMTNFRIDWEKSVDAYAKNICGAIKEVDAGTFKYEPDAKIGEDGKLIFNQKGSGTNEYIEPRITITTKKVGPITYWDVTGFGYFPTKKASSNFSKFFLKKVEEKVFENKEIQAAKNNPNKKLTVTVADIRGGASNSYGGKLTPEITITDFNQIGNPEIVKPSTKEKYWGTNKTLATDRATNLWNELKKGLPKISGLPIRISKSVKKKITGYNVETGGLDDMNSKRDWNTYPIPGQHVYISMRIELTPTLEPDMVKSKGCLWNSTVDLNFGVSSGSKTHSCDYASFKIYANGVYIGNIDLGNGELIAGNKLNLNTKGVSGTKAEVSTKPTTIGAPVAGSLKIIGKTLSDQIVAKGNGEVTITIEGDDWTDYKKRSVDAREAGTHADIPWMKVINPTGRVIYDSLPNTINKVARCGGCTSSDPCNKGKNLEDLGPLTRMQNGKKVSIDVNPNAGNCPTWTLGSFNPCATDKGQGQLSTITSTS